MEPNAPVATPLSDNNKQGDGKGLKIATIVASVVAVCGIGFGIYGIAQSNELRKENQELADYVANYAEKYDGIMSGYSDIINTPEENSEEDEAEEISKWLEELYTQTADGANSGIYHKISDNGSDIDYKPSHLATVIKGRSHRGGLLLVESDENTINEISSNIANELAKQNFSKVDGFLKYSSDGNYDFSGLGYINEEKDIICNDLRVQDMSKNPGGSPYSGYSSRLMIGCGKYNKLIPSEDSYEAKTINEFAIAYKDKMGQYPDFVNSTGNTINVYGENDTYEIDYGRIGSMTGAFFYRSYSKEEGAAPTEWKFAGLSCDDLQTEEEQKLFTCDGHYGVPVLRGAL